MNESDGNSLLIYSMNTLYNKSSFLCSSFFEQILSKLCFDNNFGLKSDNFLHLRKFMST